ncbi:hypothetical protein CR513_30226, partial [Mucuna pruriens]
MAMPITKNQASSSNAGENDTIQRLLPAEGSDEQSCLNTEVVRQQEEAEEQQSVVEERRVEALKMVEQWEKELRQQLAVMRAAANRADRPTHLPLIPPPFGDNLLVMKSSALPS